MRVFAVYSIKGGVGKTASAVNLAWLSAVDGNRTLLWDLDPQGAASYYFRAEPREKKGGKHLLEGRLAIDELIRGTDHDLLDVVPADLSCRKFERVLDKSDEAGGRLARILEPLSESYQNVFLDCPPGLSLLAESVFTAADVLLAPTVPTTLSLRTLAQMMLHLKTREGLLPRVLPFLCLVDGRRALHTQTCAWVMEQPLGFLRAQIPYASSVEQMGPRRAPICAFAPSSPAARAYEALWAEVQARVRVPVVAAHAGAG